MTARTSLVTMLALLLSASVVVLGGCERDRAKEEPRPRAPVASSPAPVAAAPPSPTTVELVEIPEIVIPPGVETRVHVAWSVPAGTDVNEEAPVRVRWTRSDGLEAAPEGVRTTGAHVKEGFDVSVKPTAGTPNAVLAGEIDLVVCDGVTHSVCVPVKRSLELGFVVTPNRSSDVGPVRALVPLPGVARAASVRTGG